CCQAEAGIRDLIVTGVQTCALPILVALVLGGALFLMFLRSDGASTWSPDDDDDSGGGGNDRIGDKPKTSPSGGIPLPFAVQSDKIGRASCRERGWVAGPSGLVTKHA